MAAKKILVQRMSWNIQQAIKLLVLLILMAYFMIWIMMPTNTFYLHWLPHIYAKLNSTYFGQQGFIFS